MTTGNAIKINYYDGLWRPVVTREYDAANEMATKRFQRFTYDHAGRTTFASYPGATDALTAGNWTAYDALGRPTSISQDSELSPSLLTTTIQYLAGFQQQATNPRGFSTVTQYQVFDVPSTDSPSSVTQSAGADTSVTEVHRDIFGKPQRIRKRNASGSLFVDRHYVYQADQQLCKVIEPETGATVFGYDWAGNMTHSASGLYGYEDIGACNQTEAWASGRAVVRTYNNMNRLTALAFPDGRGNQSWTYELDGLPQSITTNNVSGGDQVVNRYFYNKRRLPTREESSQPGLYGWGLDYYYDGNASLTKQRYPTLLEVSYSPNALGQPTQVNDQFGTYYATGINYYPNGAIQQFTYGNGILHSMTQNGRQLPDRVTDSGLAMDFSYRYDANGNVNQIYDHVPDMIPGSSPKYRLMEYDELDRLTAAGSAMFGGDHWHRFTYDALDNMKSWKLAGVKDYANYAYVNNQLVSIQNTGGATVMGLAYDEQGNLKNKNGQLYDFDYGNRLRDVAGTEWYRYDGNGRRVLSGRSGGITLSMYAQGGQLMYYEKTGSGNFEQIFLAGSLLAIRNSGVIKFQHTDALGSPVAVTNAAGAVIERNDYEPYGAIIGKPTYDAMGFTGHKQDGATGLTYMQQRYYDPMVGRFLSVDPVTALSSPVGMFNRYKYAANNPYRFVDPDGRQERTRPGMESMMGRPGIGGQPTYITGGSVNIPMHSLSRPKGEEAKTEHVWPGAMGVAQAISDGNTVKAEDEDNDGDNLCAELIKSSRTFGAAHTSNWSEGRPVQPGADIKPGTAIATFVDGKYPQVSDVKHAAVFIGYSPSGKGIMVLDQYEPGRNMNYRELQWEHAGGNSHQNFVNSASNFSTVKW